MDSKAFPKTPSPICLAALTSAAEGGKSDIAKPLHGVGSGVFKIALAFKGDAFLVIHAVAGGWNLSAPRLPEEIDRRHQDLN
jgi:hypothetical protein